MKHAETIKELLLIRGAKGISFKETKNSLIMFAPGYSEHSAAFDYGLRKATELNINWGGNWNSINKGIYSIKFTQTNKTK